jgi:tetratricopeptide (TPR) repeat protein
MGRLDEAEREAFEDHLVACAACTEELAGLCALQGELARGRDRIEAEGTRRPRNPHRTWVLAVAAAVMATTIGLRLWMREQPTPFPSPTPVVPDTSPQAIPEPPAAPPTVSLSDLAAFDPPPYAPVRLRGNEHDAAERFAEAMELYSRGDWNGALPGLRAASALDPEAPHMAFYHGACALLAGETGEAIRELQRTVALGDTPVLEEAEFLLAKAYLRDGDIDAARQELVKVAALDGDRREEAQDLLTQLDSSGGPSP